MTAGRPKRDTGTPSHTPKVRLGCGRTMYVTLAPQKRWVFLTTGKSGNCVGAWSEALSRLIALAWRKGASGQEVIEELQGIMCSDPGYDRWGYVTSCSDGIAKVLMEKDAEAEKDSPQKKNNNNKVSSLQEEVR